ncbi:MAG: 2-succinyl-5-enolpyruvyl-6-hydroxy-3-cyclohexene-1-carboxylic-acid synthase [Thermoleophilaceae bacterium]|nr:2-succinyl-5-enolpyruvyl-6-hydroxy-3-cyclohexene-1-carboxylic-acid synthase [Thermoleophilaceae bacterium]
MIPGNRTLAPLQAVADELARCGMRHAVCCPGSRNAPLLLALAGEERIRTHSVLDERSAGFVALGLAKASGRPVAVACTSGTAAANLHPAVAEAREARVPLIVLSADRPPELRDVGAGQSIDQVKLYGDSVKWFVEVGNHDPGRASAVHHRQLACRAYLTAAGDPRPGAVHLNFGLREPLAPVPAEAGEAGLDPEIWAGRPEDRPWVERRDPPLVVHRQLAEELAHEIAVNPRGALVVGATREDVAASAARLAVAAGWPLLAEPTSGVRCGAHDRGQVVAHYDALLAGEDFARTHGADLVIRIGDTPTSKPLRAWLERARQIVVDAEAAWHEPTKAAETVVAASAVHTCDALTSALADAGASNSPWLASWLAADARVSPALDSVPDPFEPKAYAALADVAADGATVFVSSSMPIRHVETYFPSVPRRIRFLANRGANGIDGVVSSAVGAALASDARCYLLTGELALLHDLGGLVAARDLGVSLTIVCTNNGGGGIFDFLPVSEHAPAAEYERLVATPRDVDLADVAALAGMSHVTAGTPDEVRDAVAEPGLVEFRADRASAVRLHRELLSQLDAAWPRPPDRG